MNLNPMVGIIARGIITPAIPEMLKTLNKPVFLKLSSLFFPEGNEILKNQHAGWQIPGKKPYHKAGFTEKLARIFQLPDMNFQYTFFIHVPNEGFKKKFCKYFAVNTGHLEENY